MRLDSKYLFLAALMLSTVIFQGCKKDEPEPKPVEPPTSPTTPTTPSNVACGYKLETSTVAYASIPNPDGGYDFSTGIGDIRAIPIGFNFSFRGKVFKYFSLDDGVYLDSDNVPYRLYIWPDFASNQYSTVGYKLAESATGKIVKIQYNSDSNEEYQVWLYEGSNKIEVHLQTVNQQSQYWFAVHYDSEQNVNSNTTEESVALMVTGDIASPLLQCGTEVGGYEPEILDSPDAYLSGSIQSGLVYSISPN